MKKLICLIDKKIDVTSKFVTTFFIMQIILDFTLLLLLSILLFL